jgi:hypothetical protein
MRLCAIIISSLPQLFCEMWSRRRFNSDAVSISHYFCCSILLPVSISGVLAFACVGISPCLALLTSLCFAAYIEAKFNLGNCEGFVLWHHVRVFSVLYTVLLLFANHHRSHLAGKVSIMSKSKFAHSLHRRDLRGNVDPSSTYSPRTSSLLARLMMWLPPNVSLQALVAAIRRMLLGGGWQYATTCAVLLLKLRPLLFCALYAAGQKWAAWAACIACDIAAIKLVRFTNTIADKDQLLRTCGCVLLVLQCCSCTRHGRCKCGGSGSGGWWQVALVPAAKSVL